MSDMDNNLFDEFEEAPAPPEEPRSGNNRNFILAIAIIGGIFLIAVIALGIIAALNLPRGGAAASQATAAMINAQNTATSQAATQVAFAEALAQTPSVTPVSTETTAPSPTPVVVFATSTLEPSETPASADALAPLSDEAQTQTAVVIETLDAVGGGGDVLDDPARTQTVAALLTQAAGGIVGGATLSPAQLTATVLPTTGFADEVGLPVMLIASVLLVGLIFVVRRLRMAAH